MVEERKKRQKLTVTAFSKQFASRGMAAVGSYSPFKLSEGSRHDQQDRIKLKTAAVRKHWKWWG